MLDIDQMAYSNKLKAIHPIEKFIFFLGSLIFCLVASWQDQLFIMLLISFIIVKLANIPLKYYLKLFMIPLGFILLSLFSIIISISSTSVDLLYGFSIADYQIGFTNAGLETAWVLFFRSLSAITTMYFLILTTPFVDILYLFNRLHLPNILIEMFSLIYRFIFVFMSTAKRIIIAQASRLGHINKTRSFYSYGYLLASVFEKSIIRYKYLSLGLESRGFDSDLTGYWNEEKYQLSKRNVLLIIFFQLLIFFYIIIVR